MDGHPEAHRQGRWAIVALVAVWLAFDAPSLTGRVLFPMDIARSAWAGQRVEARNPLEWDAAQLYYPWRTYLGDRLSDGDLPLWDPHRFAGTPYAANTQMGVWYPPNWLFAAGDPITILSFLAVLARLGTLLLAYWMFRVLDLHPYAAGLGAVAFGFSGWMVAWDVHPTFRSSAMWLPLALGGLETSFRGRPRMGIPLASLALALSLLGGHAQVALYVWLAVGTWGAVSITASAIHRRTEGRRAILRSLRRGVLVTGVTFAFGIALSSLQILGSSELSSRIVRGPEPYAAQVAGAYPVRQTVTMLVPDRLGNPIDGNYVGALNYTEAAAWVGLLSLVLALTAFLRRRDRRTAGFAAIGLAGLLIVRGTIFYRFLYEVVPGVDQARGIWRAMLLVDVALAGLAAVGLDALLSKTRRPKPRVVVGAGTVVLGALAVAWLGPAVPSPTSSYVLVRISVGAAILVGGTACLVLLARTSQPWLALAALGLVSMELWAVGFRYHGWYRPAVLAEPALAAHLRGNPDDRLRYARARPVMPANGALVWGLYGLEGNDTFIPIRQVELFDLAQPGQLEEAQSTNEVGPFSTAALRSPVLALSGVDVIAGPDDAALGPTTGDGIPVTPRPGALPPAFLVSCWEYAPSGTALERIRRMTVETLRTTAVVDDESQARAALGGPRIEACPTGSTASLNRYEEERVTVSVEAPGPRLLVLTDAWFPGWQATVDGRPAPVLVVDHAFRGVPVDRGEHRIEFRFRPGWLLPGTILTVGAVLLLVAYGIRLDRRLIRRVR